jgi:hypothetical protein
MTLGSLPRCSRIRFCRRSRKDVGRSENEESWAMVESVPARQGDVAREEVQPSGDLTRTPIAMNSGNAAAPWGWLDRLKEFGSSLCEPPHTFQEVLTLLVANISASSVDQEVHSG